MKNEWRGVFPGGSDTLYDFFYLVEPIERLHEQEDTGQHRHTLDEVTGYIHLQNKNPGTLVETYYALDDDHRIFSTLT